MKICMALIVFNGNPYLDLWLKHYTECPDIDYIVVSEGITRNMADALELETTHSTDDTWNILHKYYLNDKVRISYGFWPYIEKVDQQNTYMALVPEDTDYVFCADSDEFYHYADIAAIKQRLETEHFTYVQFNMYHFFKNVNTIGVGGTGWGYDMPIDRIFKYHPGAKFTSHRPITLLNEQGISVKEIKPLLVNDNPIMCYHYSYITEKNVYEKMLYYTKTFNRDYINLWYNPVWKAWSEETKEEIEQHHSIHPTVPGAKTQRVDLIHPIDVSNL